MGDSETDESDPFEPDVEDGGGCAELWEAMQEMREGTDS